MLDMGFIHDIRAPTRPTNRAASSCAVTLVGPGDIVLLARPDDAGDPHDILDGERALGMLGIE